MLEKCAQERDIEFLDAERRRGSSQCRRREAEKETKVSRYAATVWGLAPS